ncbi:unnamed protein product [Strongylus vulgaris]|uniref:Uncharacterized protein n=1 Tax=Strongylus vulgaris TaxID=40348 RepID=A0A3P7L4F5_STRVU|nr:unnamed protein product [Strongylus vulgaris]
MKGENQLWPTTVRDRVSLTADAVCLMQPPYMQIHCSRKQYIAGDDYEPYTKAAVQLTADGRLNVMNVLLCDVFDDKSCVILL